MEAGYFRECGGGAAFNSGNSRCAFDPGKVKMLILVEHGYRLPSELTAANLRKACYADRPERLYPIKTIVQYATSGGEAQTSAVGYGPTKLQSYSAKVDTYTLDQNDWGLRANLMALKNMSMDMYVVDDQNAIYGMTDGAGNFAGIPLSVVYPSGQEYDTESANGYLNVNVGYKDVEEYMKNAEFKVCDFNVTDAMEGLVYVEFDKVGEGKFRLREHFGGLGLCPYYKDAFATPNKVLNESEVTAMTYNASEKCFSVTPTTVESITLKAASALYEAGVYGIEQWNGTAAASSSDVSGNDDSGEDGGL